MNASRRNRSVPPAYLLTAWSLTVFVSLSANAQPPCEPSWDDCFSAAGLDSSVHALVVFDDGNGAALYAGGWFTLAGSEPANYVAKWDGSDWSSLGGGMALPVFALAVFDDGGGPALYAGGYSSSTESPSGVAKWDGSNWSALGSGVADGSVYALTVFDDGSGPALYAAGDFATAGGVEANGIAKWNGSNWSALGSGFGFDGRIRALSGFDDGGVPALCAAGLFSTAGGTTANNIAKWRAGAWFPMADGLSGGHFGVPSLHTLTTFDDGEGPALYAGGEFQIGSGPENHWIVKWDGGNWLPVEPGNYGEAHALTVFDDGSGPALYAGGVFADYGVWSQWVMKWDGNSWTSLGDGTDYWVYALVASDEDQPKLYVGGDFSFAGEWESHYIAQWNGCASVFGDLDRDQDVDAQDLAYLLAAFNSTPGSGNWFPAADLDENGIVEAQDLALLLSVFGT